MRQGNALGELPNWLAGTLPTQQFSGLHSVFEIPDHRFRMIPLDPTGSRSA